ncbi:MAG: tRNA ((37)-N6)-threonylcarbamoyltransferase complex transferase subunit TsaD [Pseudomonadota bacterium]
MILGIESSCDDSAIAIIDSKTLEVIFEKKLSQDEEHAKYGGVVPELASRLHAEALPNILDSAKEFLPKIKAIAVTIEPGLLITLLEGVTMAKMLSVCLNVPIIGVNHLMGHIYSLFINCETKFPLGVLIASGGHTQLMEVNGYNSGKIWAKTLDDSVGEAFDKCAKMMGLGYPGGPLIESFAKDGDENTYHLTLPLAGPKHAFSYSGIKNGVRLLVEQGADVNNLSASFQRVAINHLLDKTERFFKSVKLERFAVVGGVSANKVLRERLEALCNKYGIELLTPNMKYSMDNAVMIARAGVDALNLGLVCKDALALEPKATSEIFG